MIRTTLYSLLLLAAFFARRRFSAIRLRAARQDVSLDPSTAGIAAVNRAAEILKSGSPEVAISYFNDALAQARNFAVQRAIRFHLADLYVQAGRQDKALETLKDQIASIPPVAAPTLVQLVPSETPGSTAAPQQ